MTRAQRRLLRTLAIAGLLTTGCAGKACGAGDGAIIAIDGSSTVFPLTEAVAEEFRGSGSDAQVTIGVSGTGGGFKKFCQGETAITGASRPIKPSEVELCASNDIDWIELPVAYDGIAIVVNPDNDFVDHLTVDELEAIWEPGSKVKTWADVRGGWPDDQIVLFGAGVDSGTYDYFTAAIVGEEHASRGDFTASEDDNVLVQGIAGDKNGLGFFGYAYYGENKGKLKLVPVDDGDASNGAGPIAASPTTVADGSYQPLSRPIFIYVSADEAERTEVADFVDFYLDQASALSTDVGYIPLPDETYTLVKKRFDDRTTGSVFEDGGSAVGVSVKKLLSDAGQPTVSP